MSDDARAKRMAVRFTDDDLAWIAEHADDEGVEPATLVRMIINRLRRGRAPLMSMISTAMQTAPRPVQYGGASAGPAVFVPVSAQPIGDASAVADEVLEQRLAELDGGEVVQLHSEEEIAAVPLRRIGRQQYNPGRQ